MTNDDNGPLVNQTPCKICEVEYVLSEAVCDRCGQPAPRFSLASRTAIDIHLEQPVLLSVTVSVHHCQPCAHFFRVQPPFLRPDAIYTNRVVTKAVQSVYQDGMAIRRVTLRLARDFWVKPSEKMIRRWCQIYSAHFNFETDYQPWVVSQFSGVLCVDEVYQGRLALLLAVDPAAPEGDRLVGYQLLTEAVTAAEVEAFLGRLNEAGIVPDQVVTDGSTLYPAVLSQVWPAAAHQLCLFHESRRVTGAVMKLIQTVRKNLPEPPASLNRGIAPPRGQPDSDGSTDPKVQRRKQQQAAREKQIARVHHLAEQGSSYRAIARQTGFDRRTVKKWLQLERPDVSLDELPEEPIVSVPPAPTPGTIKRARIRQAQALAQQGMSYSEIARQIGAHRVTISKWVHQELPPEAEMSPVAPTCELPPPPAPWESWEQVRHIRELLQKQRFVLLKRPEKLNEEEQVQLSALLDSPVGAELRVGRDFLVDWYRIWQDEKGQRRSLSEAQTRYEAWQTEETYGAVPVLQRLQQRMTAAKFKQMSQFLRQPEWEATNNGAERAGRAFRHRQAPHFNLRSKEAIIGAINVTASLRKEAATAPREEPFHTCQRGRTQRIELAIPIEVRRPAYV